MPELPLRFIPIGAFLGDYEAGESLAMPAAVSPGGSRNMWLDKMSRATSILGYVRRNTSAVTSSVGANPMRLRHLYHHVVSAGVTTTRTELAVFESALLNWELRKSADRGATWTLIRDYGAGFVGEIPSFAQMGTTLILCTGVATPQKIDVAAGTAGDAGAAQTAAPIVTDAGVGLLQGTKIWKVLGLLPGGARKIASLPSIRQNFQSRKATIAWAAQADVETYEVYSTSGTGAPFFFEGTTPAGTLSWSSNISDIDLVQNRLLQEHGDPPPNGARYATPHKQRMVYFGSPEFPRRLWLSDAGLPESVHTLANFFELIDANEADFSDELVGGTGGFLGQLVVWLEHSIWTISGPLTVSGSLLNAERRRTSASVGAVHGRAVARVPAGASYIDDKAQIVTVNAVRLAYLTPFGDLRLFDGEHDTIISHAKADLFGRLSYADRRKAYCVTDTPRSEITWIFPHDGSTECSAAVTWNYASGSMTERPAWTFAHATQIETAGDASILLAGECQPSTGGFCYQLWEGTTLGDGATPVGGAVMLKTLYGRTASPFEDEAAMLSAVKRWRWIDLLLKCTIGGAPSGPVTFTVDCWPEEADPTDTPYATDTVTTPIELLFTADGEPILTSDGSQLAAPVASPTLRVQLRQVSAAGKMRYLHSRGVRIRISSTTTLTWSLVGANIAYQLLKGLQRTYHRPVKFATIAP